jgi:hypothetical protein
MSIHRDRQWYRMNANEVLAYFGSTLHAEQSRKEVYNQPKFLPKNTWHLYTYQKKVGNTHMKMAADKLELGDIIVIKKGDIIPATLRLLQTRSLQMQEQHVFGDSSIAQKNTFASKSLVPLAAQKNMAFPRSEVAHGSGVGIVVGLAQMYMRTNRHIVKQPTAKKAGNTAVLLQHQTTRKDLSAINTVVFDDLRQIAEITKIIQNVYLRGRINVSFIVRPDMVRYIHTHEPELSIYSALPRHPEGMGVYVVNGLQKTDILHKIAQQNRHMLFVYRGEEYQNVSNIAYKTMVFSDHASQVAMFYADIIVNKLSIEAFTSILYNKK